MELENTFKEMVSGSQQLPLSWDDHLQIQSRKKGNMEVWKKMPSKNKSKEWWPFHGTTGQFKR